MTRYQTWGVPLVSEFLGQLLFVFLHCMANNTIAMAEGVLGSPIVPAIGNGMFITILVATFGPVSGAHVNPAVSIAFTLSGCLKPIMLPLYILAQLAGAACGAGLALVVNDKPTGSFGLAEDVGITQGLLCEIMLTIVLILTILLCAIDQQDSPICPITIGFSVIVCILAGFSVSGGCMNPALSFGPALVSGKWENYWVYIVGPVIGSLMAVVWHRLVLAKKLIFEREKSEKKDSVKRESSEETIGDIENGAVLPLM